MLEARATEASHGTLAIDLGGKESQICVRPVRGHYGRLPIHGSARYGGRRARLLSMLATTIRIKLSSRSPPGPRSCGSEFQVHARSSRFTAIVRTTDTTMLMMHPLART